MRSRLAVLSAVALLSTAACNSGDDPTVDEAVGTTTTTAAADPFVTTATTGVAPATTATTAATAGQLAKTPDAAAKGLFDRWQKKDRTGAARFGRQRAIDELFSHPDTGDVTYQDQGCQPEGGTFICSWTYPGGSLQMTVEDVPGGGYIVDLVTYSAD